MYYVPARGPHLQSYKFDHGKCERKMYVPFRRHCVVRMGKDGCDEDVE